MPKRLSLPAWFFYRRTGFAFAAAAFAALTAVTAPTLGQDYLVDAALLYLVVTLVAAAAWGYAVGLAAALVAALLVNFFFVPPLHVFTIADPSNVVLLVLYLAVALIGAVMLSLIRRQYLTAEARREESETLLALSHEMARATNVASAPERVCSAIARRLHAAGCAILVERSGWFVAASTSASPELSRDDAAIAAEALRSGDIARTRAGTRRRLEAKSRERGTAVFVPFRVPAEGVLRIEQPSPAFLNAERLLRALADEASIAIQRSQLAETAGRVPGLVESDELKSALLASMSHDLRSPLTSIKASVGALRDRAIDWSREDAEGFLKEIEEQTDRLTRTVAGLLDLNRLESGVVRAQLEPVDVMVLLEEAAAATRQATAGRDILFDVPANTWVRTDFRLTTQALINLISNAATYSRPGGAITLRAARVGADVAISVRDEGPGIPAGELPHVFERFYRGASQRERTGSGLGLAIVQAMATLCGGRVSVMSNPGETVFTLSLPAAQAPAA